MKEKEAILQVAMGCLKLAHIDYEQSPLRCVWKSEKSQKTSVNWYSHGARYYDPQLARWHSTDPLSELYTSFSPYNYVVNNPVNYIDPNGMTYNKPSDWEREQRDGEGIYYNWELANKMAGMTGSQFGYGSGADAYFLQYKMQGDAAGGWRYHGPSGGYINLFAKGLVWGANDFNQDIMPAFQDPNTTWYGSEAGDLYAWSKNSLAAQQILVNGMNWGGSMSASDLYGMSLQSSYRSGLMADGDPPASNGGGGDPSLLRKIWDYTYGAPLDFIGGAYDFAKNYHDMRKLNLKNSDKYFHSKANFQATKRGPGGAFFAIHFSNLREIWDQRIKGDTWFDSMADQEANMYGRELGWDYRYIKGPIDYSEVLNKYWYDYFPDGY